MRWLLLVILITLMACGSTKIVEKEVPIETVRTEYINTLKVDSVFVHDSIDRFVKGDTVNIYKYKYIYKYLYNTDTICKTDSIEKPVYVTKTEIKEVNKIKWYQSFFIYLGIGCILVLLYKAGNLIRTFIKKV